MNLVIAGQKWLGSETLRLARELGQQVLAVCPPTTEDRLGRAARREGIPVVPIARRLGPENVPADTDLILAAQCHAYIARAAREKSRLGAIGYHPSLLPRHRGRDAVRWAIHMGETITGGTVYWMTDVADAGPIAAQDWCHILPGDTPPELWRRELGPMGLSLFEKVLSDIEAGRIVAEPQEPRLTTWEPAFHKNRLGQ